MFALISPTKLQRRHIFSSWIQTNIEVLFVTVGGSVFTWTTFPIDKRNYFYEERFHPENGLL